MNVSPFIKEDQDETPLWELLLENPMLSRKCNTGSATEIQRGILNHVCKCGFGDYFILRCRYGVVLKKKWILLLFPPRVSVCRQATELHEAAEIEAARICASI